MYVLSRMQFRWLLTESQYFYNEICIQARPAPADHTSHPFCSVDCRYLQRGRITAALNSPGPICHTFEVQDANIELSVTAMAQLSRILGLSLDNGQTPFRDARFGVMANKSYIMAWIGNTARSGGVQEHMRHRVGKKSALANISCAEVKFTSRLEA